jgi:hypothetical protein
MCIIIGVGLPDISGEWLGIRPNDSTRWIVAALNVPGSRSRKQPIAKTDVKKATAFSAQNAFWAWFRPDFVSFIGCSRLGGNDSVVHFRILNSGARSATVNAREEGTDAYLAGS